jgi:hypothetical protein
MTQLTASGCKAWITSKGEKLPVYQVKTSRTAWGGDLVEAYVPSKSGTRFQIKTKATWVGDHRMLGICYINGERKYYLCATRICQIASPLIILQRPAELVSVAQPNCNS